MLLLTWSVTSSSFWSSFFCHPLCMPTLILHCLLLCQLKLLISWDVSACLCLLNMPRCTFVQYYSLFAMTFLLFHWPHDKCPYSTTFRNLGWDPKDGESHLDAMLRPVLLDALVKLGHDKTIHEGARRFRIFVHGHNTSLLPSDTRKVLFSSPYMLLLCFT